MARQGRLAAGARDSTASSRCRSEANAKLKARNDALDADVRDLKTGSEAIEERARSELGMVRQDEVFFQLRSAGQGRADDADACRRRGTRRCRSGRQPRRGKR